MANCYFVKYTVASNINVALAYGTPELIQEKLENAEFIPANISDDDLMMLESKLVSDLYIFYEENHASLMKGTRLQVMRMLTKRGYRFSIGFGENCFTGINGEGNICYLQLAS